MPGEQLAAKWTLEEHKLGETSFTHYADGTGHKNRMQGNDFVQSTMYKRGVTCFSCHDVHGTQNNADLIRPANQVCLTCHNQKTPNGPPGDVAAHTHHQAGSAGSECAGCHMPKIEQTVANVNVRSHTFNVIFPASTTAYKIPNSCNGCHTDKDAKWAETELAKWPEVSPWRVAR